MKKEKTIRTYQRRTKTGKVVTVKQHTAKYDAAEALREAAKKKGAGDELEALKKKPVEKPTEEEVAEFEKLLDSFPDGLDERERKMRLKQFMKAKGKEGRQAEIDETKWEIKEEKKARKVWKANEKFGKRLEKSYEKEKKSDSSYEGYGFTKDEFKEWYEGTGSKADKKVEKALKKAMGAKAYNALSDKAADEYKKGGAHRFFTKGLEEMKSSTSADMKSVNSGKAPQGDQTVSASMLRGTKKEKVTLTGKSVKDSSSDSLLRIGKRKDGSYDIFESSDNGKSWSYAEGWKDAGDYKGTAESSLARKNGFKIVKDGGIAKLVSKVSNIYGGMTKEEFEKRQRDFTKRVKDADKGTRAKYSFTAIKRKIKEADISDAARKRLLKSISKPYAVVTPAVMEKRLQKELDKSSSKEDKPKSDDEKPRMHTVKTPKGTTTLPVMKTLGKVGETRYTYDSAGNIYKPGKAGGAPHIKLSDKKATEILDKLNISSRKFSAQVKESFSRKKNLSAESKDSKISDSSLKAKGYVSFKDYGTTLYIGKRGKAVYMKTSKGIVKADRDDYADFVTGHNGLSKANRKKLESLGWHEHEEY